MQRQTTARKTTSYIRRPDRERLTRRIQVLFTESEARQLEERALAYPYEGSVSALVRGLILKALQGDGK